MTDYKLLINDIEYPCVREIGCRPIEHEPLPFGAVLADRTSEGMYWFVHNGKCYMDIKQFSKDTQAKLRQWLGETVTVEIREGDKSKSIEVILYD